MILFSHPTGNANVRHAALGLNQAGLLGELWTCLHHRGDEAWRPLVPGGVRRQLERRHLPRELWSVTRTYPWREAGRLAAARLGWSGLTRHETGACSVDAVYRSLDARVARAVRDRRGEAWGGVYAYEDGAAATFAAAKGRGTACFYDLPIGYWRAAREILLEEAEREPEWAGTLSGNRDSEEKTARKDAELAAADLVLVASSFTLSTLSRAPGRVPPAVCLPYGAPVATGEGEPAARPATRTGGALRVLFVGSLGQRKGLSYLFAACERLRGAVELTVIGTKPAMACAPLDRALARHRWIPSAPHREVLAEMAAHDVFVFPSLFEGFGLVLLEAMAQGLPIIATPHTAAPDLITDGVEGFLVPVRSADGLAEKLEGLRREPERRRAMGEAARRRATAFDWEVYGRKVAETVAGKLAEARE